MNVKDRILEFLKYKGISITKVETLLCWSKGALLKSNSISSDRLGEFYLQFPEVSPEWILTGQGEMLNTPVANEATQITTGDVMMVPLVTEYAHARYLAGYGDAVYMESLPKIPWVVDHEYKGRYVCFEVRGDSMDDGLKHSYEQGDILLCREILPIYWRYKLHYNKWNAFVVVHKTLGIVVKQIIDQDVENGIITCHSFNPIYEDFKVDLREVVQLFNVVKHQSNG